MSKDTEPSNLVTSIVSLGEEKLGELVNLLLANERFVGAVQNTISTGLNAKNAVDKNVERVMSWVNIPTLEDLDQLKTKMDELEEVLFEIGDRVKTMDEKHKSDLEAATKAATKKKAKKKTGKSKRTPAS